MSDQKCPYCDVLKDMPSNEDEPNPAPEGYCAWCQNCGKAGHVRHYPGPVAYTGAWCEECYKKLPKIPPAMFLLWLLLLIPVGLVIIQIFKLFSSSS